MSPEPKLSKLYQEVILDHNSHPRNFKEILNPTHASHGFNPLCGDDYELFLNVDPQGIIQEVGFKGAGCAISKSSASIMTSMIKGRPIQEALGLKNQFVELLTHDKNPSEGTRKKIGKLTVFEGVREFPVRVKCTTLIWHTLRDALEGKPVHKEL